MSDVIVSGFAPQSYAHTVVEQLPPDGQISLVERLVSLVTSLAVAADLELEPDDRLPGETLRGVRDGFIQVWRRPASSLGNVE